MNNSFLAQNSLSLEEQADITPILRAEESKLIKIIQAVETIEKTLEWQILKELVFDDQVPNLERMIKAEAKKQPINTDKIHSLNGQLAWVDKFTNFSKLADVYRIKLREVKEKLNVKATTGSNV